jgi:hypothetical protein
MDHLEIRICYPEELFKVNAINAYEPRDSFESGFEHIYHKVSALNPNGSLMIHLKLTHGEISQVKQEAIIHNIKAFCKEKVVLQDVKKKSKRKKALSTIIYGLTIMMLCLTAAYFIEKYYDTHNYPAYVIAEGLKIWAWISLWPTGEILLFEQWNYKHQVKVYKTILEADLIFE